MYDTYDTDRLVALDEVINTEENNAEALCLLKKILVLPCMSNAPQRFVRHLKGLAESEKSFYMTTNSKRQKYKALLLVLMVLGYPAEMIADHLILVGRIHYKENKDVTVEVPMMEEEPLMDDAIVVSRGSYLLVPSMTVTGNCSLPGVFQRVVKEAKLQFSFPSSANSSSPMLLADAKYADILGLGSVAKFLSEYGRAEIQKLLFGLDAQPDAVGRFPLKVTPSSGQKKVGEAPKKRNRHVSNLASHNTDSHFFVFNPSLSKGTYDYDQSLSNLASTDAEVNDEHLFVRRGFVYTDTAASKKIAERLKLTNNAQCNKNDKPLIALCEFIAALDESVRRALPSSNKCINEKHTLSQFHFLRNQYPDGGFAPHTDAREGHITVVIMLYCGLDTMPQDTTATGVFLNYDRLRPCVYNEIGDFYVFDSNTMHMSLTNTTIPTLPEMVKLALFYRLDDHSEEKKYYEAAKVNNSEEIIAAFSKLSSFGPSVFP